MNGWIGFICIVAGMFAVATPYSAWYLSVGWKFKEAEPSDLALTSHRIGGCVLLIVGLILMVSSCSFSSASNWPERFQNRLTETPIAKITVGFNPEATLSDEEILTVAEMLQKGEYISFDPGTLFSYNTEAVLHFADGYEVSLYITGNHVEVHPNETDKAHRFMDDGSLGSWFSSHYPNP